MRQPRLPKGMDTTMLRAKSVALSELEQFAADFIVEHEFSEDAFVRRRIPQILRKNFEPLLTDGIEKMYRAASEFYVRTSTAPTRSDVQAIASEVRDAANQFIRYPEFFLIQHAHDRYAEEMEFLHLLIETKLRDEDVILGRRIIGPAPFLFHPPPNRWEEVTIKEVDEETVRITVGESSCLKTFVDMGMKDNRNAKPNEQWLLLRKVLTDGRIAWAIDAQTKLLDHRIRRTTEKNRKKEFAADGLTTRRMAPMSNGVKSQKKRLAAILRSIFQLSQDPFHDYRKRGFWLPRFKIKE